MLIQLSPIFGPFTLSVENSGHIEWDLRSEESGMFTSGEDFISRLMSFSRCPIERLLTMVTMYILFHSDTWEGWGHVITLFPGTSSVLFPLF